MNNYLEEYKKWLLSPEEEIVKELKSIENNHTEIKKRFYKHLKFGTAGLREVMGAGTNRINIHTISNAAEALAKIITKKNDQNKGVIIVYDTRNKSENFASAVANILAANNIICHISDEPCPVPILSFAIRALSAFGGIAITASHNPPIYNGLKVYNKHGAQIEVEEAEIIHNEMINIDFLKDTKKASEQQKKLFIKKIDNELYEEFYSKIKEQLINAHIFVDSKVQEKIIYSPLHGSGKRFVKEFFEKIGFKNLLTVKKQEELDVNFQTIKCPNPEYFENYEMAIRLAKETNSNLIIATDPDCDRVGVVAKDEEGKYKLLNGNEIGILLSEYVLSQKYLKKELPTNGFIAKSIVSTNLVKKIAKHYKIETKETLTGFKYIGKLINDTNENNSGTFIFGFEESFGYLLGEYARDKDAILTSALIVEMHLYYNQMQKNIFQKLREIYEKHGYFSEETMSIAVEEEINESKLKNLFQNITNDLPKKIADMRTITISDHLNNVKITLSDNNYVSNLQKANMLIFELEKENKIILRVSGTEPKLKFYFLANSITEKRAKEIIEKMKKSVESLVRKIWKNK